MTPVRGERSPWGWVAPDDGPGLLSVGWAIVVSGLFSLVGGFRPPGDGLEIITGFGMVGLGFRIVAMARQWRRP